MYAFIPLICTLGSASAQALFMMLVDYILFKTAVASTGLQMTAHFIHFIYSINITHITSHVLTAIFSRQLDITIDYVAENPRISIL